MRGLLYVSVMFFDTSDPFCELFQHDGSSNWKDVAANLYSQAVLEDDSFIRQSLMSRLPFQVRNDPEIRAIADDKTRREKIDKKVQAEASRILDDLHDLVRDKASLADTLDIFSG